MSVYKDTMTESNMNGLVVVGAPEAPIQQISKEEMILTIGRLEATLPNIGKLNNAEVMTIAQESLLFRTVPGRDMHYYSGPNGLVRIPDYKYLKNLATFKEQMLSGDDGATVDDKYHILTADEKDREGIKSQSFAARCTITTASERKQFADEVKMWLNTGLDSDTALKLAIQSFGEIGTKAVGVVDPTEKDRKGKAIQPPKGWSFMQLAEKLAFKNAVNRRYGQPTADEMAAMAHRMAQRAMPEHWRNVDPTLPIEAQAKTADLVAQVENIKAEAEVMTTNEHKERLVSNVSILRDTDDVPIGEDVIEAEATPVDDEPEPPKSTNGKSKIKNGNGNGDKSDPWPAKSGPLFEWCNEVRAKTDYYTNQYHLINTVGGAGAWLNDPDNRAAKLSEALDHATQTDTPTEQEPLFPEPEQQTACGKD